MLVRHHHLFNRLIHPLLLTARGESRCQRQEFFLGLMDGLDKRPHPGHGGIKFTLAVNFFGKSHGRQQLLQMLVGKSGEVAVRIHGQNQKLEQRPLLGI